MLWKRGNSQSVRCHARICDLRGSVISKSLLCHCGVCCYTFSFVWQDRMTIQIRTLLKLENLVLNTNIVNAEVVGQRWTILKKKPFKIHLQGKYIRHNNIIYLQHTHVFKNQHGKYLISLWHNNRRGKLFWLYVTLWPCICFTWNYG